MIASSRGVPSSVFSPARWIANCARDVARASRPPPPPPTPGADNPNSRSSQSNPECPRDFKMSAAAIIERREKRLDPTRFSILDLEKRVKLGRWLQKESGSPTFELPPSTDKLRYQAKPIYNPHERM